MFDPSQAKKRKAEENAVKVACAKIKSMVEERIPLEYRKKEGPRVAVKEVVCGDPECAPVDTFVEFWYDAFEGEPPMFTIPMRAAEVTVEDIEEQMPEEDYYAQWARGENPEWPPPEDPPLAAIMRFGIKDEVWVKCGDLRYRKGVVEKVWHRERTWPKWAYVPYQVRLTGTGPAITLSPDDEEDARTLQACNGGSASSSSSSSSSAPSSTSQSEDPLSGECLAGKLTYPPLDRVRYIFSAANGAVVPLKKKKKKKNENPQSEADDGSGADGRRVRPRVEGQGEGERAGGLDREEGDEDEEDEEEVDSDEEFADDDPHYFAAFRFNVGDRVVCWLGDDEGWKPGTIVARDVPNNEDEDFGLMPYLAELDGRGTVGVPCDNLPYIQSETSAGDGGSGSGGNDSDDVDGGDDDDDDDDDDDSSNNNNNDGDSDTNGED